MIQSIFLYLGESSLYIIAFLLVYKLFISRLTHFKWMRAYLLVSLGLCIILPLVKLPGNWYHSLLGTSLLEDPIKFSFLNTNTTLAQEASKINYDSNPYLNIWSVLGYGILTIYIAGVIYKLIQLWRSILSIQNSIRQNPKKREGKYWIIDLNNELPAYSFFNYIFINHGIKNISKEEIGKIKSHEFVHSKQFHSLDTLLVEFTSVVLWFNPIMKYLKNSIQEVHEYLADKELSENAEIKKSYSNLLLRLTAVDKFQTLSSAFSAKQISRRIIMLEKNRSLTWNKILFILLVPVAMFLLLSFSYLENRSFSISSSEVQTIDSNTNSLEKIGKIIWVGNTVYSDKKLGRALGLKKGDNYSFEKLNSQIWFAKKGPCSLYMDNGYISFYATIDEDKKEDGTVDLILTIDEGIQTRIGQIIIVGNENIPEQIIFEKISIKSGELFNRAKLNSSLYAIRKMGRPGTDSTIVKPIVTYDKLTREVSGVDIEYILK